MDCGAKSKKEHITYREMGMRWNELNEHIFFGHGSNLSSLQGLLFRSRFRPVVSFELGKYRFHQEYAPCSM